MTRSIRRSVSSGIAAFILTAAIIPVCTRAEEPFAIVRAGDRALSCDALAGEINLLSQPAAPAVAEEKPKKHGGLGFLKVLSAAAPFVPGVGGIAGSVVSGVAMTAGASGAQHQADDQMADARKMAQDAMAGGTPQQQRKDRLTAIFDEKKC